VNDGTAPAVAERTLGSLALRAISALAMAPVAVGAILLGSLYFDLLVALGCGVLAWEWRHLCGDGRFGGVGWLLMGGVLAVVAAAALGLFTAAGVLALGAAAAVYGTLARTGRAMAAWHAAGVIYLAVPSVALLWLYGAAESTAVLWLFLVVWATDIGAYAAGRLLGGPRLAPRLSPNKTWAGVAGGFVAAAVAGSLLGPSLGVSSRGLVGALSAFVSLAAQLGDLAESAIKRHFKVKDMSGLIPGHGGLFDRVDGLLAAAPAVALVELFSGGGVLSWR